jgi:hypothetical protein
MLTLPVSSAGAPQSPRSVQLESIDIEDQDPEVSSHSQALLSNLPQQDRVCHSEPPRTRVTRTLVRQHSESEGSGVAGCVEGQLLTGDHIADGTRLARQTKAQCWGYVCGPFGQSLHIAYSAICFTLDCLAMMYVAQI